MKAGGKKLKKLRKAFKRETKVPLERSLLPKRQINAADDFLTPRSQLKRKRAVSRRLGSLLHVLRGLIWVGNSAVINLSAQHFPHHDNGLLLIRAIRAERGAVL